MGWTNRARSPGPRRSLTRRRHHQQTSLLRTWKALAPLEGVPCQERNLPEGLGRGGTAIVNADNEFWPKWREKGIQCASFEDQRQPFHARDIVLNEQGCARFVMVTPQGRQPDSGHSGRHNVANALAAAAGTLALGASLASAKAGLAMAPVKGRFCVQQTLGWPHLGG